MSNQPEDSSDPQGSDMTTTDRPMVHIGANVSGRPPAGDRPGTPVPIMDLANVSVFYGNYEAVRKTTLTVARNQITALIGPSGCGKSTILRSLNRMNDLIPGARVSGSVTYHGQDLYAPGV